MPELEDHPPSELRRRHIGGTAVPKLLEEARFEDEIVVAVVAAIEVRADGGEVLL